MSTKLDAVILSIPYGEITPMVAPVLLSACLNKGGVSAKGIDLNLKFYQKFENKPYFSVLKNQLIFGYIKNQNLPRRAIIDVLKFNKHFLLNIKKQYDPEWIGISVFSQQRIDFSYLLIYSIRKYLPDVKIVIGGKGSEIVCQIRKKQHAQLYIESGAADLAVVGDCEHIIAQLIKDDTRGLYISPQQTKDDLDDIPLPNWEEYDLKKYLELPVFMSQEPYMAITASKGCVRDCTFCDVANFWPKYIYRDPNKVANEMITAYNKTGVRSFIFTDNLINGSVSNYRNINKVILDNLPPRTLRYGGYAIFRDKKYMLEEDFRLAAEAGCKFWAIGVESGSERLRFEQGKKITDEDLDWSVANLSKYEIEQRWLMMCGYPTETEEDHELTLELYKKYAYLGKKGLIKISVTPTFMLLKNSPLLQNIKLRDELGLAHNLENPWMDRFWTTTKNPSNTFPVRLRRWREQVDLIKNLGYTWGPINNFDDAHKEVNEFEKLYESEREKIEKAFNENLNNDQKSKVIPIYQVI